MSLLEEYFEIQYADDVSIFWKITQIFTYVSAAGFGIWSGFTLALLRSTFNNKCFLYAKILWDQNSTPGQEEVFMDTGFPYDDSIWSHDTICEYCQYSMVSSFIFATIWATFFLMCGKGGKSITGLPQPWRIALPSMIFNFIYFLIAFAAALQIQQGTDVFCEKKTNLNKTTDSNRCFVLQAYESKESASILLKMEIAIKTSWLTAASWFFAFLITLMRILFVADFEVYKICVYKVDGLDTEKEEVLKLVDYVKNKTVHFSQSDENHLHGD